MQQIKAKAVTLKQYTNRVKQYYQNRLFKSSHLILYQEFNRKSHVENVINDKEKTRELWSDIWDKYVKHNKNAD